MDLSGGSPHFGYRAVRGPYPQQQWLGVTDLKSIQLQRRAAREAGVQVRPCLYRKGRAGFAGYAQRDRQRPSSQVVDLSLLPGRASLGGSRATGTTPLGLRLWVLGGRGD